MTDARQLRLFADCPYGGCEDGYCACLEQDIDPDDFDDPEFEELDEETRQLLEDLLMGRVIYRHGRPRRVDTLPDIATYTPEGVPV